MQGNIKVVVRCRPMNARESSRSTRCLVKMENNQTILLNPKNKDDIKAFTFDKSYWSGDITAPDYADQETVYNDVGREWLDHAFNGYNCCIFAYGQTGSGKSYSMMGYGKDKGIIPRTCSDLFERILSLSNPQHQFQVEVSFIEIYNERVRDLLNPTTKHLKVREHPSMGPYVEDLSRLVVNSFDDIEHLMDEGNKARTVAATRMNETSSRSHAVFTIILTHKIMDGNSNGEKVSRFSLVDLAGSERANSTGASGVRLKEGANINRSLTTLGKVIAGLAESNKKRDAFIPYRDSVLTWLLKDSLGGNSKTAMIAAISPADYDETLSTLRYADQAKKIKTKAVVNEDPNVRLIRDLNAEIQNLKQALLAQVPPEEPLENLKVLPSKSIRVTDAKGNALELTKRQAVDQLLSSQKLLGDIDQTWEERLQTTLCIQQERERALEQLGISVANMGVYTPKNTPYLVNLNEDPLMTECLVYQIKPGTTIVGREQTQEGDHYIRLDGSTHCRFENVDEIVTIYPTETSVTIVNGIQISEPKQIKSGYRIILGDHYVFRFNHPEEARRAKTDKTDSDKVDWHYATKEAVMQYYQRQSTPPPTTFDDLTNDELEKLFDQVTKLRMIRKRQSSTSILSQPMSPCSSNSSFFSSSRYSSAMYETTSSGRSSDTADDTDSIVDLEIIRLVKEEWKQQMDDQKQKYEKRIHRLSCLHPVASPPPPPMEYSCREKELLTKVIRHWRDQRYVHLAETLLTNGATLYEANALARQLGKKVVYQLTIIHNTQAAGSEWEEDEQASRLDPTLLCHAKPCIGVRVVDSKHQCTFLWSLDRLKTRLRYMQGTRFVTDQPHHLTTTDDTLVKKHVHVDGNDCDDFDLFYDSHCPRFALIGIAQLRLRHLGQFVPLEWTCDVFCQRTCSVVGQLTILVTPIARSKNETSTLQLGQHLVFEIKIGALAGIDETEFTHVHCQYQLFDKEIYATPCASHFVKHAQIDFNHCQTFSRVVTADMLNAIHHGELSIEVYGQPQPRYLKSFQDEPCASHQLPSIETKYNVYGWVQVCELARTGEYTPVQVLKPADARVRSRLDDDVEEEFIPTPSSSNMASNTHTLPKGTFVLRQGHQRRIVLTIRHDWDLTVVDESDDDEEFMDGLDGLVLWLGDIRYRSHGTTKGHDVAIPLTVVTKTRNTLVLEGAWDSSMHDSLLLNRVTESDETVDMTMKWVFHGAPFQMDIGIRIVSGDSGLFRRPSLLRNLFGSVDDPGKHDDRKKTSIMGIYRVWERPRHFTNYHVKVDNDHHAWQQHQMAKIKSYELARKKMLMKLDVAHTRYTLALRDALMKRHPVPRKSCGDHLLHTIIHQWMNSKPEERTGMQLVKAFGSTDHLDKSHSPLYDVHQIYLSDVLPEKNDFLMFQHYGYMKIRQGNDPWQTRWFLFKRPYLLVYANDYETNELDVLNVQAVRVNSHLKDLVNTFTLYTNVNTYQCQTTTPEEMREWVACLI